MEKIYIEIPDMPCSILLCDGIPTGDCEKDSRTAEACWNWLDNYTNGDLEGIGYVLVIDGTGHL